MKKLFFTFGLLTASLLSLQAEPITVLTSDNRLLTIDSTIPGTVEKTVTVTGLDAGESLLGIDTRPASGQLFGLGSTNRVYAIDANTGVATAVGPDGAFTLDGTSFGFDFNPVPDRIRITSDADQNIRVNPNDNSLSGADTDLAYDPIDVNALADPNVVGSAYVNSFPGAQVTTLYDIDSALDILAIQTPPNAGTLRTVGGLGVDTSNAVGFDVSPKTGVAYASLTVAGVANLYTINLLSGEATAVTATPAIAPTELGAETVVGIAASGNPGARLRNMSTRGRVGEGEDRLIGGFIIEGPGTSTYILRAIGPDLANREVSDPLADPVLTLFNDEGDMITSNDDFAESPDAAAIAAVGLAPAEAEESAIRITLLPGTYTAQVTRKDGDSDGVALVEIFEQP